ncbi:hypothetical protein ACXYN8_02235 [Altererythrobacter sp. CAU 1778]
MQTNTKLLKGNFLIGCGLAALAFASPASAQEFVADAPLNDTCVSTPNFTCSDPVKGTRTVTTIQPATVTATPEGTLIEGAANVQFDGELQVSGFATSTVPEFAVPGYSLDLIGQDLTVTATTDYDVDYSLLYPSSADPRYASSPLADGTSFVINSLDVSEIGVDVVGAYYVTPEGNEGEFSLSAIDSTNIVDNGTALSGSFSSTEGRIVFGTLSGTATVVAGSNPTTIRDEFTGQPVDIISPLALEFDVTATVLTQLDETGLITPRIAVTDGIEMNGSRITGLADGVAATDAATYGQVQAEATARADADATLAAAITSETDARIAADAQIVTVLDQEIQTRTAADLALSQRIDSNTASIQGFAAADAAETSARIAADAALGQRIDGLDDRLATLESRIDRFDDRIASSAAVATAMSGNAFLPDMNFNLTANVATYDGAQAGSMQLGALVSKHVAINAGIASGFNKGGKTAGRVGVTVGW